MSYRIFLAGAAGAIGSQLTPLLQRAGHHVTGTTRSPAKAAALHARGVEPVVVDVFDAEALSRAVAAARPEIVIHQLTDLPPGLDLNLIAAARVRNARLREEGTRNLALASAAAGAKRLIAQSIAWVYAAGPEPHAESDPLDSGAGGVIALEHWTLNTKPLQGIVLRYGQLYGPGTGFDRPSESMPVHVEAAAHAAFLAVDRGVPGIFNVAEPNGYLATEKARRELRWDPDFRLLSNALG